MRTVIRDRQQGRMYRWEFQVLVPVLRQAPIPNPLRRASKRSTRGLIARALRLYGISSHPSVTFEERSFAAYSYVRDKPMKAAAINLPDAYRQPHAILHEVAHAVARRHFRHRPLKDAVHGGIFVRVYLDLLEWHYRLPRRLSASQDLRLRIAPARFAPRPRKRPSVL
jgi:hypothetical protein